MRMLSRLLLPLLLLLFSGAPAYAQEGAWTISEAKGVVTVIDSRGQRVAKVGTQLAAGATVRTDARGSAVLVRGKEFVTLRQNAQLRIAPAVRERGIIQIIQDYGSALFNIGKQPNPHFGVETPYLAAVVKGTTFVITVSPEGASLQVTEGAVETSTLDRGVSELIRPGAVAMIAAADPLRMVVEGEGRRVLDSPARGAAGASAAPAPASALSPSGGARIENAIVSTPQDLGAVSNGFVSGEVAVLAAVVVADNTGRGNDAPVGNSGGRSNDGEVCAGGTCSAGANANGGASNGSGSGSAGSGGNGANGPDNGAGAGNGNAGNGAGGSNNANGNGNGNGNGAGSNNGNGNGAGGNGNGNGGAGNGNGGAGNGGGSDNGGGGGNGAGGSGNGNGNGNGNGGGGIRVRAPGIDVRIEPI